LGATIPFDEGVKLLVKQYASFRVIQAIRRAAIFIVKGGRIMYRCNPIVF
jgi:hypothetical protein